MHQQQDAFSIKSDPDPQEKKIEVLTTNWPCHGCLPSTSTRIKSSAATVAYL